ncbi:class F sortase [Planococcus lenghuensis]|uniref:Class F sortase n=1 Tax=Planococcus lenghuensis TaxID=2213202 RepID=A0A1Q2L481_9BACL|nr:class F sortase [Planococcus lenghuensis]AQQ55268.1 hypothetical protein B0X71_18990 [Planococcus lenghuensis]
MKWTISILSSALLTLLLLVAVNAAFFQHDFFPEQPVETDQEEFVASPAAAKRSSPVATAPVFSQPATVNSPDIEMSELNLPTALYPTAIEIPGIAVSAEVKPVGVLANGQMGVPADTVSVGWFEPGIRPGNIGNAVIAGHVDSRSGPAVFFHLKELKPGDEITVSDGEGQKLVFVVREIESYKANDAPLDKIFGATDRRMLNLITCTGTFNGTTDDYSERLVVYSELK